MIKAEIAEVIKEIKAANLDAETEATLMRTLELIEKNAKPGLPSQK